MSDDDEWEWIEPPTLMMGAAQAGTTPEPDDEEGPDLYVPDLSSLTGWSAHRVTKPKPMMRVRRAGFIMRRRY